MKKIVIISLADEFGSKTSEIVASDLDMFFLKVDDYIDYNMFNSKEVLSRCGIEYFKKQETKFLNEALGFINTLYYISYDLFINNQNIFEKIDCEYIYIALSLEQLKNLNEKTVAINSIAFEDRDKFLRTISLTVKSEILVKKSFANKIVQKIKKQNQNNF
ncbi:MAG: hypothetical protein PHO06_03450 [Clostridia bacterium]|nr:hypothetical protein [Clostridia bacterium]